ncbi:T9SS type A sorting domain-containing protein [Cloacibacterium rupense]|nr:T9SS type A sorting domain-containing protein [Cloacibacterium rupense]
MKKFLFFVTFSVSFLMFSGEAKAQETLKEPLSASQKSDDGALVAYPNPTRDFIIVKAKNPSLKVKSIAFYSIIGTQVLEVSANANSAEVRLDKLKPGKYLMRYTLSDNTQKVTQIVKQ